MVPALSLRERKKQQTRQQIITTALRLFERHGFEHVSLQDVAASANVSKMTVFNYFATKEDLVFYEWRDQFINGPARAVRERRPGESALAALERSFLDRLAERDPLTGLNEIAVPFFRIVMASPTLMRRQIELFSLAEDALAEALAEIAGTDARDVTAIATAGCVLAIERALISENCRRLIAGESPDDIYPDAVRKAKENFRILYKGLPDIYTTPRSA